jgi:hypothetical protein
MTELDLYKRVMLIVEHDDSKGINVESAKDGMEISIHRIIDADPMSPVKLLSAAGFEDITKIDDMCRGRMLWSDEQSSYQMSAQYLGPGSISLFSQWLITDKSELHETSDFRKRMRHMNRIFNAVRVKLEPGMSAWR